MDFSIIFIPLFLTTLAVVALLVYIVKRHRGPNRFTPLAGLSFGFMLAGLFAGGDRMIGYSLITMGIALAVVDIIRKLHQKR